MLVCRTSSSHLLVVRPGISTSPEESQEEPGVVAWGRGCRVLYTAGRKEHGTGHAIWWFNSCILFFFPSFYRLILAALAPCPSGSSYGVFPTRFPGFPVGYRMFSCLWAPTVNTQSARHFPLYVFLQTAYQIACPSGHSSGRLIPFRLGLSCDTVLLLLLVHFRRLVHCSDPHNKGSH